jgi:aminodeoxychorismate synthase component I
VDLDFWVDPEVAYAQLAGDATDVCWLDSGPDALRGRSYIGIPSPRSAVIEADVGEPVRTRRPGADVDIRQEPGTIVDVLERELPIVRGGRPGKAGGLTRGWVGWFGYEAGAELVGTPAHASALADSAFLHVDRLVAFDHASSTVSLHAEAEDDWIGTAVAALRALRGTARQEPPPPRAARPARLARSRAEYLDEIESCVAAIVRGDAYQICLTDEIAIEGRLDPLEVYRRLRRANPSHHGGLLRIGGTSLLSASPELFLTVDEQGRIVTRPIKGTAARGSSASADRAAAERLRVDEKETAENLMIVDLMRNDLGRVARTGTVQVPELFAVETYATLHQLVSTVEAELRPGLHPLEVVRAALPAGSMTGAPKHSAMTILDGLEGRARGLYAGCFGYLDEGGRIELAMTIRSIVVSPERTTIGTGGGITALSDPGREFDEILLKADALLTAAGATLAP